MLFNSVMYFVILFKEILAIETEWKINGNKLLSRRKRYLTFPAGTSLQLVFCVQTPALSTIGDILLYSNTAALAWPLPEDDSILKMFKGEDFLKGAQRKEDNKHIYYVDEEGKVISKIPYRRRLIVNPAFAKRSVDTLNRTAMHQKQSRQSFLKVEDERNEFHRRSRVALYDKLALLYKGIGLSNGRHCLLRQLCETRHLSAGQGTFLQEIIKATFTLPAGQDFINLEHQAYDEAHMRHRDCTELYPDCSLNVNK